MHSGSLCDLEPTGATPGGGYAGVDVGMGDSYSWPQSPWQDLGRGHLAGLSLGGGGGGLIVTQ
jgi:hypothetical protein